MENKKIILETRRGTKIYENIEHKIVYDHMKPYLVIFMEMEEIFSDQYVCLWWVWASIGWIRMDEVI